MYRRDGAPCCAMSGSAPPIRGSSAGTWCSAPATRTVHRCARPRRIDPPRPRFAPDEFPHILISRPFSILITRPNWSFVQFERMSIFLVYSESPRALPGDGVSLRGRRGAARDYHVLRRQASPAGAARLDAGHLVHGRDLCAPTARFCGREPRHARPRVPATGPVRRVDRLVSLELGPCGPVPRLDGPGLHGAHGQPRPERHSPG